MRWTPELRSEMLAQARAGFPERELPGVGAGGLCARDPRLRLHRRARRLPLQHRVSALFVLVRVALKMVWILRPLLFFQERSDGACGPGADDAGQAGGAQGAGQGAAPDPLQSRPLRAVHAGDELRDGRDDKGYRGQRRLLGAVHGMSPRRGGLNEQPLLATCAPLALVFIWASAILPQCVAPAPTEPQSVHLHAPLDLPRICSSLLCLVEFF